MESQPKRHRVRKRSIAIQLQIALDDAARAMTADVSIQKLVQQRIACLLNMQAREQNNKLRKALAEVASLRSVIERLRQDAAKPAARPLTPVDVALQKYSQERGGTS